MVAAPQKRRLNLVMHDFEPGWDTYVERQGYAMEADAALDEVKGGDYAAILIIGGRAPEYLRRSAKLIGLVREFDAKKKWIFSICHGIQVLIAAGVTKGRTLTCYEHVRFELESSGGVFSPEQAARDGHIVTAQNWGSHPEFYREIFAALRGKV